MARFLHLPSGYTSLQPPTTPPSTESSSLINAEYFQLNKSFSKQDEKVGLCLSNSRKDNLLEYIALCNLLQYENKKIKFYPCFTDPEVLLFFLNAFSLFTPRQSIPKRFCRVIPNEFHRDLNANERRTVDIEMLDSMPRVIMDAGHPYRDFVNESKILPLDPQEVFIFNLEGESSL